MSDDTYGPRDTAEWHDDEDDISIEMRDDPDDPDPRERDTEEDA